MTGVRGKDNYLGFVGYCERTDALGGYRLGCSPDPWTDAKAFAAHAKAEHKGKAHGDPRVKVFKRPTVTLSKIEKEWLGQYVTVIGGGQLAWQVWSLSPRGGVWLVRGGPGEDGLGNWREARIQDLTPRASASEYEDVAFNFEMDDAA